MGHRRGRLKQYPIRKVNRLPWQAIRGIITILSWSVHRARAGFRFKGGLRGEGVSIAPRASFCVTIGQFRRRDLLLLNNRVRRKIRAHGGVKAMVIRAQYHGLRIREREGMNKLSILHAIPSTRLFVRNSVLLSRVRNQSGARKRVLIRARLTRRPRARTQPMIIRVNVPLFTTLKISVTVILRLRILRIRPGRRAVVRSPLISVQPVLCLPLLHRTNRSRRGAWSGYQGSLRRSLFFVLGWQGRNIIVTFGLHFWGRGRWG